MNKKIFAMIFAAIMIFSLTATALAAPDETAAPSASPSETAEPTGSPAADPTASPAPTSVDDAAFVAQVKAMSAQVLDLSAKLRAEKKLDQTLRSQIASLKGVYTPNPKQDKAYKAEMEPLQKQLKSLEKELEKLNAELKKANNDKGKGKGKNTDSTKTLEDKKAKVEADIADVNSKIAAVNAKYGDLLKHQRANASARKTLNSFRRQLRAEYAKLAPYIRESGKLSGELHSLVGQLRDAIEAGDITLATDTLTKITVKVQQLTDNINQRIAIRGNISKMLQDYKASLEKA